RQYPVVLTVHDIVNHPARGLMLFRTPEFVTNAAAKMVDAVIVHGNTLRDLALQRYQRKRGSIRVHSVDHGVILRYGTGSARKVVPTGGGNVLFFGFLQRNKGLEYLVEAEAILRQQLPNLSMVVAGAAHNPTYYQQLFSKSKGISLRIGHQDGESVERLFRWADVVVLPYIEASQSGVFQVAVAFGVPTVATQVGGFQDVIRNRVNGLLVPPRDSMRLGVAIKELLIDTDLRTRIIGNLESDRECRFSWNTIATETLLVYRQAIARFRHVRFHLTATRADRSNNPQRMT